MTGLGHIVMAGFGVGFGGLFLEVDGDLLLAGDHLFL